MRSVPYLRSVDTEVHIILVPSSPLPPCCITAGNYEHQESPVQTERENSRKKKHKEKE
jgi:hypothetical protein